MRLFILLILAALMTGCGGGAAVRNREAWKEYATITVKANEAAAKQRQDAVSSLAMAATACQGDARCVEHVTSVAALAMVGSGSGATPASIAAPPREPSGVEKFAQLASALSPLAGTIVQGAVQMHQADTSRDVSLAQYGFLGSVVHDVTNAASAMQPSITVGGDYGNGNVRGHVGDAIGGSVVGGDQIGHDRVNNSGTIHLGDGDRYGSPGPYTGPICEGTSCQTQQPADDGGAP